MATNSRSDLARRIGLGIGITCGAFFCFTAVLKALDANRFAVVIDAMLVIWFHPSPEVAAPVRTWITALVVAWEALLGVLMVTGTNTKRTSMSAALTILVFTVVLIASDARGEVQSCGCFGKLSMSSGPGALRVALWRNAGLLVLLGWAWWSIRAKCDSDDVTERCEVLAAGRRGFSLIELLVVIAVIAVLVAITLPALRGSKEAAGGTENASAEKQLLTATSLYVEAYAGYPPYLTVPGDPTAPSPRLGSGSANSYFRVHREYWATLLADGEYIIPSLCENREPDQAPTPAGEPFRTVYFFTQATAAEPAFWVGEMPPNDLSLFRGVRLSRVQFPSAKGLIAYAGWGDDVTPSPDPTVFSWPVGFADGSVSVEKLDDTAIWRGFGASSWIVCTTEKGVEGRDYP